MITETCFHVRYTEIDSLGIVHHSKYPIWFEAGRNDYLKNADIPNSKMNALGLFLPLSEIKCRFKSPAKYGDKIQVNTKLIYISCVKVKFEYQVLNRLTGKVLATGRTVHVWTNHRLEPLNIEKTAPEIYTRLRQLLEPTETS